MAEQSYKYKREDFGDLPVSLNHLTMYLNFLEDHVQASNLLHMTAKETLNEIELDAKNLEILSVVWLDDPSHTGLGGRTLEYEYRQEKDKLIVQLARTVSPGDTFYVRTLTKCVPTDNILEGIYKDVTPTGAPQQYMSQCQQWGFQRIMPIFDDCRAKCTMTTTIEADARYTHLISNGNISTEANPDGQPVLKPGDHSRKIITYENSIPMAPYLFLICVGTWDTLDDQITYENGTTVRLEYLVPPGRMDGARIPMEILKRSVLWIADTQDYTYSSDVYRTICMSKSNFGGMENVGNTTIVTDAALIDEHTLDQHLVYAHRVIVHEFEHNQCGSETTMDTPFDVWLNEAYTVDVERQFVAEIFDSTFTRLSEVDSIRDPLLGPLAIEDSGSAGQIVRDGFNSPDELVDAVTYVKAAEVIRMLRLIIGAENFRAGKTLYFTRYTNGNADTDQFFECFEEVSGRSLEQFKKGWLYQIGYPKVTANIAYDIGTRTCTLRFRQLLDNSAMPFHVPIDIALIDGQGNGIPGTEKVFQLMMEEDDVVLENLSAEPAFASVNRGYSFYGTFKQENITVGALTLQVRLDTDPFNRVEAMRQLTDQQRIGLLLEPNREIDTDWLATYGEILADRSLAPGLKSYFLRIDEQPMDRTYATWFQELVDARESLARAVNAKYRKQLVELYDEMQAYRPGDSPNDGIEQRILKHVALDLIAVDDAPDSHRMILNHYNNAKVASERVAALALLNRCSAPERREVLEQVYRQWHPHLSGYANYLRIISGGTRDDVFDMIEFEKSRSTFDVTQPTWARALFLPMALNNKKVWTDQGIRWVKDTVVWLASINDYTASRLLNVFQQCKNLRPALRQKVQTALEQILAQVPESVSPTIHGQAKAYLGIKN